MAKPEIADYLRIARLYHQALSGSIEPRGSRLELPFTQAIRLLSLPSAFNDALPQPFVDVARRLRARDPAMLEHFRFDENREFFLSDLFDYIQLQARRRKP